ncbi:MAG: S-layer protein [Planctomycetaceae bacterium]|nr:S-layer protein [Planctomycetaceae bacterium]
MNMHRVLTAWTDRGNRIVPSIVAVALLLSAAKMGAGQEREDGVGDAGRVAFTTDVVPVLTKLGCNSGGCHGKSTGQNGFKLSLLGFVPEFDHQSLVKEGRGRRVFAGDPGNSLLLQKAIGRVPHGGGRRVAPDSIDYQILANWIRQGANAPRPDDPLLVDLEITPVRGRLAQKSVKQLKLVARFSNGTLRDVTRQALYLSNEPGIAAVGGAGEVRSAGQGGLFAVLARYGGRMAVYHGAVPFGDTTRPVPAAAGSTPVDRFLVAGWSRLGILPSPEVDDATLIRRLTLDICGTLPTVEEVREYLADRRPDKRSRLVNRLLDRPGYAAYFAMKWADILQNRGKGYSTGKQRAGTALFAGWIRDSLAANKPYNQFVAEILTATGSQRENPPTVWYRQVRTSVDYVESVAQAFLGVRIQCAQCHHHPFERWSQADYYGLAAVFARVGRKGGFADAEVPTNQVIYVKSTGAVQHPRTGRVIPPRPLGGPDFDLTPFDDPRQRLVGWLSGPGNPFFARTLVNRMWGHFLGRGIIPPIDDARASNPPSNPELLEWLTRDFIESGFDLKHVIRQIVNCRAYRLSSLPNASNGLDTQFFARFYPRRLAAEVLLDGISQVLDVPTSFPGDRGGKFPEGTRAIELPDENVAVHFLDVFGRPARTSACECERADDPALAQALELVSSKEIQRKLTDKNGYAVRLASNKKAHSQNIRELFVRVFARPPRPREEQTAKEYLESEQDRAEGYRSLLWALLATNEFLFNH